MKKLISFLLILFAVCSFSFADKVITLSPGWNVVSTPQVLSGITFSNDGVGISFYTLSGNSRISTIPTIQSIRPLEGFVVNNSTESNATMNLIYKTDVPPMETLFQKTLNLGWNLLGITTITNPFANIGSNAVMSIDFTKNNSVNLLNGINSSYEINNTSSSIATPQLGEAYGVFVPSIPSIYGGNQNGDPYENPYGYGYNLNTYITSTDGDILGNESYDDIGSINFSAGDQDIKINSFQLYGSGVGLYPAIASIRLYKNYFTLIAIKTVNANLVIFSGLNLIVPKGSTMQIRIDITTNKIGSGFIGVQTGDIYLAITGINAVGLSGGESIISTGKVASQGFSVLPIIMSADVVSDEGSLISGTNILGKLNISKGYTTNTRMDNGQDLKVKIRQIKIKVNKGLDTLVNNYTIEREGGSEGVITGSIQGNYVVFLLSGWNTDNLITGLFYDNASCLEFKANVLTGNGVDEDFIQISIDADDIIYSSDDPISYPIMYSSYLSFPALIVGGNGTPDIDCDTPENTLACSLGLDTCPDECTTFTPASASVNEVLFSGSETVVIGLQSVPIFKFNIQAGSGGDISVSRIKVKLEYQDDVVGERQILTGDALTNLTLYRGYTVYSSENINSYGIVDFNGFNFHISSNTGQEFTIRADIHDNNTHINDKIRITLLTGMGIEDDYSADTIVPTGLPIVGSNIFTIINAEGILETNIYRDSSSTYNYILGDTIINIGSIYFSAENENIKINNFQLYGSGVGLYPAIASIILYSGEEMIAIKSVDSNLIFFSGINLTVPKGGSRTLDMKIVTNEIGSGFIGVQTGDIYLSITGINAVGLDSFVPALSTGKTTSLGFTVLPGKISHVNYYDSANPLVDGVNLIGRMGIQVNGSNVIINQIKIKVNKGANTIINNYTIEKEYGSSGGPQGPITGYVQGNYVIFTGLIGTYNTLLSIRANITKGMSGSDFVQISIEDFSNGDITYSSNEPTSYPITDLKIGLNNLVFPGLY